LQDGAVFYLNVHRGSVSKVVSDPAVCFDKFTTDPKILERVFRQKLFAKTRKRIGPPTADEVYAFEPALALGGAPERSKVRKVDLRVHLELLRGLVHRIRDLGLTRAGKHAKGTNDDETREERMTCSKVCDAHGFLREGDDRDSRGCT
jgi:hypothetical protein